MHEGFIVKNGNESILIKKLYLSLLTPKTLQMSVLKEIDEANEVIKGKALNLLVLPFWYISLYLFNNEFFVKQTFITLIAMCIALTLTSCFILALGFALVSEDDTKYAECQGFATMVGIIWLSILTFCVYSWGFLKHQYIYFYWFIVIYFVPIVLFLAISFIINRIKT